MEVGLLKIGTCFEYEGCYCIVLLHTRTCTYCQIAFGQKRTLDKTLRVKIITQAMFLTAEKWHE